MSAASLSSSTVLARASAELASSHCGRTETSVHVQAHGLDSADLCLADALIRADEMRFAVLVGHVFPEAERVLSEHDGRYLVVEKIEDVRGIVEQQYGPRTRER